MKEFAQILADLLSERNLSQKEFGALIGASKNQIYYWLKNKTEPDLKMLRNIAVALDVSVDYLLALEDELGNKMTAPPVKKPEYVEVSITTRGGVRRITVPKEKADKLFESLTESES